LAARKTAIAEPKLCASMTDSDSADDCWAALAEKDGSFCSNLRQEDRRTDCLAHATRPGP
jgi:hypothetical protein